jgi:hypothetical protein
MQQIIMNQEQRFCYKCHYPAGVADAQCQRCGSRALKTKTSIRTLGVVLIVLGGFISAMMGAVMSFMFKAFSADDGAKFRGDETQMMFAVGIIGLTFAVGIAFALAGAWQVIFGRRNTVIVWAAIGMVAILLVVGKIFTAIS